MKESDGLQLKKEFAPVSPEQWDEVIKKDLKGADYDKKLVWRTDEQIAVKPYYTRADLAGLEHIESAPGDFPFVRGTKKTPGWATRQEIDACDVREANHAAREAINGGAEEICFVAEPDAGGLRGVNVQTLEVMKQLLDGIELDKVPVHFRGGRLALPLMMLFMEAIEVSGDSKRLQGSMDYDPLADIIAAGGAQSAPKAILDETAEVVRLVRAQAPHFRPLMVSAGDFREYGATTVQEVAYAVAEAVEYLSELSQRGLTVDQIAEAMVFSFSAGTSFFFEIAKLRAFRMLWARVAGEFKIKEAAAVPVIHSRTAQWSATIYDPYVNVLRGTTQAMSAAVAGSDAITVTPFDAAISPSTELSRRLSRNTQTILKREAYLDRTADPAAGSYYVEVLTDSIAREAWKLFQEIEKAGGFVKALEAGTIQKQVLASRKSKEDAVAMRRRSILGTNQYPNRSEHALQTLGQKDNVSRLHVTDTKPAKAPAEMMKQFAKGVALGDFVTNAPLKYKIEQLTPYRASEGYEALRLRMEHHAAGGGRVPRVYLLEFGDVKMRKARSGFVANFFGCGGFEVKSGTGETLEAAVHKALEAKPDVIALCSSDAEYQQMAKPVIEQLAKSGKPVPVIVAGYPTEAIEQLRADGVTDFVHVRTNPLEFLSAWQRKLGVQG